MSVVSNTILGVQEMSNNLSNSFNDKTYKELRERRFENNYKEGYKFYKDRRKKLKRARIAKKSKIYNRMKK